MISFLFHFISFDMLVVKYRGHFTGGDFSTSWNFWNFSWWNFSKIPKNAMLCGAIRSVSFSKIAWCFLSEFAMLNFDLNVDLNLILYVVFELCFTSRGLRNYQGITSNSSWKVVLWCIFDLNPDLNRVCHDVFVRICHAEFWSKPWFKS